MAAINILGIIIFIIVMITIVSLITDDKSGDIVEEKPKYSYKYVPENMKKRLKNKILDTTDFDTCIMLLAEYSKEYGINKNPEDYVLFKNHLDTFTKDAEE